MSKYPIFALFLCLVGCVQTARSPKDSNRKFIAAVRDRVSQVRQMEPLNEVPIVLETKDRLANYIDDNLQRISGRHSFEDTSLAYTKLGLLPRGADLKNNLLNFYASQAMAFYDSRAKQVVLSLGDDTRPKQWVLGEKDDKVIAHELVHAFQDQKFSIGDRLRVNGNGDAALALRAVAEGDAVVSEYAYAIGGFNEWLPDYVGQLLEAGAEDATLSGMPVIVSDRVRFQYFAGVRFVSRALRNGGWSAVNRLYHSPPLSTEQILHPEKYFEVPDLPARIELKNLFRLFPSPWRQIENDTLGELSVQCLFGQFAGPSAAATVAQGWDGDRFVAYRKGDDVAFIWATIWDSAADADEFYEQYHEIFDIKYGARPSRADYYAEKRGYVVLVIEGIEREEINRHIGSVWAEMFVQEESLQPSSVSASNAIR